MQRLSLPFGGGWALTADTAAIMALEVKARSVERILELGSGVSTLILGQIARDRDHGHVVSIDHDPYWAELTRRNVRAAGL
jgi:predicted O-methyltransferase YrrM